MRQVSDAFAARLAAKTTTLCACWRFTRRDEMVFGATDHDTEIAFDDVIYAPTSGLKGAVFESSGGLAPTRASASGALSLAFVDDADLDLGLWDGAHVDVWRVDWAQPEQRIQIWAGQLSDVVRQGQAFVAELVSLKAQLERPIGRVYARQCDADVGDARCGVDLGESAYRAESVVSTVLSARQLLVEGLDSFEAGWFAQGVLTWISGDNAGRSVRVSRHASDELDLAAAPAANINAGDAFEVTAGYDKSFATCLGKFANAANFRGFPHMPGTDAVLAGPASDRPNDGGKR